MKKLLNLALIASICFASCSKKSNPTPAPADVLEYDFTAKYSDSFVILYYNPKGSSGDYPTSNSWSTKVTIPSGTKSANIYITAAQQPPYTNNNSGTVTIKLNGKVVATGSGAFTDSQALAQTTYAYTSN